MVIIFALIKKTELTPEGEAIRLYFEVLGYSEHQGTTPNGEIITIPERKGIDLLTAAKQEILDYLSIPPAEISNAIKEFCNRFISVKFDGVINSINWIGEAGIHPKYRKEE